MSSRAIKTKDAVVHVRLTPAEHRVAKRLARARGLRMSQWVRELIASALPPPSSQSSTLEAAS